MEHYQHCGKNHFAERKALKAPYQDIRKGILDVGDDFFRVCAIADCSVDSDDAENYITKMKDGKRVITPRGNNASKSGLFAPESSNESDTIFNFVTQNFVDFDVDGEELLLDLSSEPNTVPIARDVVVPSPRGMVDHFDLDLPSSFGVAEKPNQEVMAAGKFQVPACAASQVDESGDDYAVNFRKSFHRLLEQYAKQNSISPSRARTKGKYKINSPKRPLAESTNTVVSTKKRACGNAIST